MLLELLSPFCGFFCENILLTKIITEILERSNVSTVKWSKKHDCLTHTGWKQATSFNRLKPLNLEVKAKVSAPKILVIIPHCTVYTAMASTVQLKLNQGVSL